MSKLATLLRLRLMNAPIRGADAHMAATHTKRAWWWVGRDVFFWPVMYCVMLCCSILCYAINICQTIAFCRHAQEPKPA